VDILSRVGNRKIIKEGSAIYMQIFVDSASIEEIENAVALGIVSGVTTNPSLISKSSNSSFKDTILKIASIAPGPISAEVTASNHKEMLDQAKDIVNWSKSSDYKERITIKVPATVEGIKAVSELTKMGISTNCTLVFSVAQALLACEAGATFISPFVGRIDDIGHNGIAALQDILETVRTNGYETKVIAASIRHMGHVTAASMLGCDIATIPFKVIKQMYVNPLTEAGVRKFEEDWEGYTK